MKYAIRATMMHKATFSAEINIEAVKLFNENIEILVNVHNESKNR